MKEKMYPKWILNNYKSQILSEVSESTEYFHGAYLLNERIVGKRIKIHVLFVYDEVFKTFEFTDETCFSIFNWIQNKKEKWFQSLYEKQFDFDLTLYPHYMSLEEFNELEMETRKRLEKFRLAHS